MEDISNANILIVDDEPINLELLEDLLELNDFKNVIPVNSAIKAYRALEDNSIDLIFNSLKIFSANSLSYLSFVHKFLEKSRVKHQKFVELNIIKFLYELE